MTVAWNWIGTMILSTALAACAGEGSAVDEAAVEVGLAQRTESAAAGVQETSSQEQPAQEQPAEEESEWPERQPRRDVQETIEAYKAADPGIAKFFESAAGYVVFPGIGKGGLGIGGAHGNGEVIQRGVGAIGKASITQITVGLQIGGQEYSEIIFLEEPVDLERFTEGGGLELAAQVSAVAIKAGAADAANYKDGVVVFTRTKSGMMGEASVGGQKFKYEAY